MLTMPDLEVFVTLGVDTHKDVHVAVALDRLGRWLGASKCRPPPQGTPSCWRGRASSA